MEAGEVRDRHREGVLSETERQEVDRPRPFGGHLLREARVEGVAETGPALVEHLIVGHRIASIAASSDAQSATSASGATLPP